MGESGNLEKKSLEWLIRLQEDIKTNTNGKFVCLTFSNQSIAKISRAVGVNFKRNHAVAVLVPAQPATKLDRDRCFAMGLLEQTQ